MHDALNALENSSLKRAERALGEGTAGFCIEKDKGHNPIRASFVGELRSQISMWQARVKF